MPGDGRVWRTSATQDGKMAHTTHRGGKSTSREWAIRPARWLWLVHHDVLVPLQRGVQTANKLPPGTHLAGKEPGSLHILRGRHFPGFGTGFSVDLPGALHQRLQAGARGPQRHKAKKGVWAGCALPLFTSSISLPLLSLGSVARTSCLLSLLQPSSPT